MFSFGILGVDPVQKPGEIQKVVKCAHCCGASGARMSHQIRAVVPFSHGSNENRLIVVMFFSDLNVKRSEGNRA